MGLGVGLRVFLGGLIGDCDFVVINVLVFSFFLGCEGGEMEGGWDGLGSCLGGCGGMGWVGGGFGCWGVDLYERGVDCLIEG